MYSFYEGNSTAINAFRGVLTYIRDAGYATMKDENLSIREKQAEVMRMNNIIQESAIRFKDAYEKKEFFDYGKSMDEIIEKMRTEKKDIRGDLKQQQNVYSPYWQLLRQKESEVFARLKDFGGFKDLDQRVEIPREGRTAIELDLEKSRIYNEKLVEDYGKQIKRFLGESSEKYQSQQEMKALNPANKGTRLDETYDQAWKIARENTNREFLIKKLYEN
jgi:hypothetical protein